MTSTLTDCIFRSKYIGILGLSGIVAAMVLKGGYDAMVTTIVSTIIGVLGFNTYLAVKNNAASQSTNSTSPPQS